ncbi:MAG: PPC domain-containing protein, partial [Anaerolineales bacterium]|nr:PPC domain-containing protein [Anaerolineales bacterium]
VLPKYDEPGAAWDPANDMEPNDVLVLANALDVGLSHWQTHQLFNHASYATNGPDHDWYRFTAEAGRTYVMETYNVQSSGNATGLWLFDASGAEIINDRYGNNGTGTGNARIVYTFTTGGTYFLLVRQESFSNFTGTYSIRVLPKYDEPGAAWDPANDMEPNDVRVLATPLQVGAVHGEAHRLFDHTPYVTADSDHDWYWFTAVAGIPYVIQTYGVQASGRATGLWLYNDSGTLLEDDQYGSSQTGQASLTYTFVTPGTYFVLVKDARTTTWSGPYSVRVCELDCAQFSYLPVIR